MTHSWKAIVVAIITAVSAPVAEADTRDHVNVAAPWEISGPDPATDGFIFLRMGVMETLVDASETGDLMPGLAIGWDVSEDELEWRFDLREAAFHDGTTLTGDAVALALSRAAAQPGPLEEAPLDDVGVDGDTVVISLTRPFAALPAVLAHSSTVILAPAAFDGDGNVVAPIGTGPFEVTEIAPPQTLETARFEDYWGAPPTIASASYLASKRAETRALMAESGDADLVFTLDPSGYKRLGQIDQVEAVAVAIPRVMLLKVNAGHPAMSTPAARRALSLAIDRQGIAAGITRFPEAAATQLFPPILSAWHDPTLPALAYDPEEAKALLTKEGWMPGEDGILTRDGERFSLTLRTFPDRPEQPLVAAAIQDQWRAIGVELEVSVSNYSEIPAGHQDGSLEVALFARNYGLTPDPIGTVQSDFPVGGSDWGAMGWDAPAVSEAVAQIAATADEAVRVPLIKEVTAALHAEMPLIPLVWYQHTVAYAGGLEDVIIDPLERDYGLDKIRWVE
ncbi:MAG: ABC transporter substrate-binding protein [Geminicoccaceae bacterium]